MTTPLHCPRCGFRPFGPAAGGYRSGSACPQCSAPLVAEEGAPAPDHGPFARPIGLEDRGRRRAGRRGARRGIPPVRILTIVLGIAIAFQLAGGAKLARQVRRLIEAALRWEPSLTLQGRGAPSDRWGPLGDFHLVAGTWDGAALDAEGLWTFRFTPPARVDVVEPDGETWLGEGRVYWERGDEDGLRVLPGGYPFDVALQGGEPKGRVALGTYRLRDPGTLELCLGRPGALVRTSEFGAQPGFTCWLLLRRGP